MDKRTMINELIRLYDENAELKNKLKGYEVARAVQRGVGDLGAADGLAPITVMCIDAGRKALWNKVIDKYNLGRNYNDEYVYDRGNFPVYVRGAADENGKQSYVFLTYEQWIKTLNFKIFEDSTDKETMFYLDCIKQYSMNELIEFFSQELHEVYDSLVNSKKMALVREAKNNE